MILAVGTPEPAVSQLQWALTLIPMLLAAIWGFHHLPRLLAHDGDDA